jgi:hypothetical protein
VKEGGDVFWYRHHHHHHHHQHQHHHHLIGQPFLFRGAPYLAVMDEEEEDWNR